jgi:predicted DNA-binding transcriptional regulator YafY
VADPTVRTLQLLELLQSAPRRTVGELAQRLGVDERTIRRDVARLVAAGVHVEALRGRHGGYCLAPGSRVLPVMFSSEEVVAVLLGLARARPAAPEPEIALQTALAKIKRALRPEDAKRLDTALGAMAGSAPDGDVDPDPAVTLALAEAVDSHRVIDLRYRSAKGVPTRRRVYPHGLVAHGGRWYLMAFDADRGEDRTFRLDRIETARALSEVFAAPQPPGAATRLVDHFAEADYRWMVVLRIRATEDHIRAHLPSSVARLERMDGALEAAGESQPPWHRAEIHAESLDWIPAVIAALGCEVTIDRPDELRDRVRAAAARMLQAASGDPVS